MTRVKSAIPYHVPYSVKPPTCNAVLLCADTSPHHYSFAIQSWKSSVLIANGHVPSMLWSGDFSWNYGPLNICIVNPIKSCLHKFSATSGWISAQTSVEPSLLRVDVHITSILWLDDVP